MASPKKSSRVTKPLLISGALVFILAIIGCAEYFMSRANAQKAALEKPQGVWHKTIVVAADMDYSPFSFFDDDGAPSGRDVELMYALSEIMRVDVDLRLLPWTEAQQGLRDGSINAISSMNYANERLEFADFTTPTAYESYVTFGLPERDFDITKLRDKRVAILDGDMIIESFVIPFNLRDEAVYYTTYSEAFKAVAQGDCEYVIAPYIIGKQLIKELKLNKLRPIGPTFESNIYCIGVGKGQPELVADFNAALAELTASGELTRINHRWTVEYVQPSSFGELISANKEFFILLAIALVVLFLVVFALLQTSNNRKLQAQISRGRVL